MRIPLLALIVVLAGASTARATEAKPTQRDGDSTSKVSSQTVNADQLGVSIDRIRLRFKRAPLFGNVFDPEKLKLTAYVDVVAKAPEIKLFGPNAKEELTSRAVPFGAPTHRDMLAIMTPIEFRTSPMDLTALIKWLADQLEKKKEGK